MGGRKAILLLEWKYRGLWTVPVRVTCSENIDQTPKKDLYACLVRVTMKCKMCKVEVEIYEDWSNYEFIYKTSYCRDCLIKLGYCD